MFVPVIFIVVASAVVVGAVYIGSVVQQKITQRLFRPEHPSVVGFLADIALVVYISAVFVVCIVFV